MNARKYGGGKTPHISLRVEPDEELIPFQKAVKRAGTNMTAVLRAFMAWYSGKPGAELPQRPEPPE